MSTTQHTPGPWAVNLSDVAIIGISRPVTDWPAGFHDKIADCVLARDHEQNQANARLIAAAPDLLAALKEAEALLANDPNRANDGWLSDTLRIVRAAIAKAESGQ